MYKRVLVPLDGSELAEVVFSYATELAARLELDLVLLHVVDPHERDLVPLHRAYVERAAEVLRRQSEELQKKAGIQPKGEGVAARGELAVGHPAEEILECALRHDIDLILMAPTAALVSSAGPLGALLTRSSVCRRSLFALFERGLAKRLFTTNGQA